MGKPKRYITMDISDFFSGPNQSKLTGKYNTALNKAAQQYGAAVDQAMSPFAGLANQTDINKAQQDYLGQLKSYNPNVYNVDPNDYKLTNPDVSPDAIRDNLDPSIDYQIEQANKSTSQSAAGRGGLFSGATGNTYTENARKAAETGWGESRDFTRQSGLDVNDVTDTNFNNQLKGSGYNANLINQQMANAETAYNVQMSPFEQIANANLGKAGTMYNTATTAAGNTYNASMNKKSPFEQLTSAVGGAAKVYNAFK